MTVERSERDGVVELQLANPPLNAIDRQTYQQLLDHLEELAGSAAAVVLLSAQGRRIFSAGADLAEIKQTDPAEADEFARWRKWAAVEVVTRLQHLPIPTIAVVNGAAVGIGCSFAMSCDFRIAAPTATFSLPEVRLGSTGGIDELEPANLATGWYRYLVLTGEAIDAATAMSAGLVQRVVPPEDLRRTAADLAERMQAIGADKLRRSKAALLKAEPAAAVGS